MESNITIEDIRNWWDYSPCNVRRSAKPVGSKEYFNDVRVNKYFVEGHIPYFADFPRWNGKTVLEVGCGIGIDTTSFTLHGARVIAVDLSIESIKLAEKQSTAYQVRDRIEFIHGDMERLSKFSPRRRYDLIYSFGAVHHTLHPEVALEEMRKVAERGHTRLKIMLYHRKSWRAWEMRRRGGGTEAQQGCPVAYQYSRDEATRLVESSGWKCSGISVHHIFPWDVRHYMHHRYVKAWPWKVVPSWMMAKLAGRWGWHLCIDAEAK